MTQRQKAFVLFAGAVVVEVLANRYAKQQAATLGLPAKAVAAAAILAAAVLA
ncbi:hypothetical protein PUR59_04085 [Streptomyces sp. SP18ES09]|uniref:hypothetical protein n=1 Tax=Streptomyces sp. SP18ES09 TaxID=3002532 RepID=UPI002E79177A|nr:hypothetical protein [Streptomyces sp. SP18ES09]MEE1814199.1 hypothetical protein [Streptomyces sp. SP18ES09]